MGNSLTYVGNLPATFDGLSRANGRSTESSMIVAGGATLTQRVADGSVERALASGQFQYLILQERGAELLGGFGEQASLQAEASLAELAAIAWRHGVRPVLLGTYQLRPKASAATVDVEAEAAQKAALPYLAISNRLQAAMAAHPEMQWLHADGQHPGYELILLEAAMLYQQIFDALPAEREVTVEGPMYGPSAKFGPDLQTARRPAGASASSGGHRYTAEQLARIAEILRH